MERPKGLLLWQGRTLIESQVNAILQSSVCELVVVLGYLANVYAPLIRKHNHRIKIVVNDAYDEGKTASIRKGLKTIHPASEAVLIVNVDQPVTAHTVDRMIRHMVKTKKPIVIPAFAGRRGHPVLFSTCLMNALQNVNEKTEGLKHVIRTYKREVAELDVTDGAVLYNFNRLEDYLSALRKTRRNGNENIGNEHDLTGKCGGVFTPPSRE